MTDQIKKKKLADLVEKMMKEKKICPEGKVLNPKTNRCIKSKTVKKIDEKIEKKCPEGKVLNPKTNRCIADKTIKKKVVVKKKMEESEKLPSPKKEESVKSLPKLSLPQPQIHEIHVVNEENKQANTQATKQDRRQELIDALEKLRKKEIADKQVWKARAYLTVIKQLKSMTEPIYEYEDLKNITGIGKSIEGKIKDFFTTGKIKQLENYNASGKIKFMDDLMKIHGIGAVKAKELVEKHNINSIDDLKQHPELLNDVQKKGLMYWEDFEKRIPRKEMEKHEEQIISIVKSIDPKLKATITGSYRRNAPDSGDIDVLITHPDDPEDYEPLFKQIVEKFRSGKDAYIKDILAFGGKKSMAVCRLPKHKLFRRFDLLYTRKHEYPFALLYFTGSGDFNVKMRNLALSLGYTLSEYGIKYAKGPKKGEFVDHEFETEEDIFDFLGLKYIKPELRNPAMIDNMKK